MSLDLVTIGRAALLGLATGSRSVSGLAAQAAVTPSSARRQPERLLGHRWVKGLLGLAAAGEIVGDKLPTTPSRLAPPVLGARLVLAAATALLAVRARDEGSAVPGSAVVAVPVAVGASLASAYLGHAWRGWASTRLGPDWPGAVGEDVVALSLAAVATRA